METNDIDKMLVKYRLSLKYEAVEFAKFLLRRNRQAIPTMGYDKLVELTESEYEQYLKNTGQ